LKEVIKVLLFAPATAVVVVADLAHIELTDGRITPVGQFDAKPGCRTGEQPVRAMNGLRKPETLAVL